VFGEIILPSQLAYQIRSFNYLAFRTTFSLTPPFCFWTNLFFLLTLVYCFGDFLTFLNMFLDRHQLAILVVHPKIVWSTCWKQSFALLMDHGKLDQTLLLFPQLGKSSQEYFTTLALALKTKGVAFLMPFANSTVFLDTSF